MKRLLTIALTVFTVILFSGCVTTPPKVSSYGGENRINGNDINVAYVICDGLADCPGYFIGTNPGMDVTDIWKHVFIGNADADTTVKVLSHSVISNTGFSTSSFTYTATVEVTTHGKTYQLTTRQTRRSALMMYSATRQAVELGVCDISQQVKSLLKQQ